MERNEKLLSTAEAAEYLGVEVGYLYWQNWKRRIRQYKLGKENRYRVADLEAFLAERAVEAADK